MKKTSITPQLDFTLESGYLPCHRPTKVTGKMNLQVIELLRDRGIIGATAGEINQHFGWTTASAKLSELRSINAVRKTEARRAGRTVWVLA